MTGRGPDSDSVEHREVYTDGGARPNPGPGGWAAVILDPDSGAIEELSGSEAESTNNRMELTAAIRALEHLHDAMCLDLYTDSRYLRQGITQWLAGWIRRNWQRRDSQGRNQPVKNVDLWRRLAELDARHQITWHWLKGHAGNRYNERADELASLEIERLPQPERGDDAPAEVETDYEVVIRVTASRRGGAWGALVLGIKAGRETQDRLSSAISGASANRLEIEAALAVLDHLEPGCSLSFRCSDYLRRGATEWLPAWRRRGWKTAGGDPVKNAGLWRRLEQSLGDRQVCFLGLIKASPASREAAALSKDTLREL